MRYLLPSAAQIPTRTSASTSVSPSLSKWRGNSDAFTHAKRTPAGTVMSCRSWATSSTLRRQYTDSLNAMDCASLTWGPQPWSQHRTTPDGRHAYGTTHSRLGPAVGVVNVEIHRHQRLGVLEVFRRGSSHDSSQPMAQTKELRLHRRRQVDSWVTVVVRFSLPS